MTRAVVIGAGLLGSAVADELAGQGVDTVVLEADQPASGTSGASFAWINAQDKAPDAYFALNVEGMRSYPALAAALGGDWFHAGGDIAIGRGPDAARLTERVQRHRAAGYSVRELDRAAVARLEPSLALPRDGDLAAAHFPDEGWIDAPALIERRLARAVERGADVRPATRVAGFDVRGGRIAGVRTEDGAVAADVVLLAAGNGTEALAGQVDVTVPMAPSPGLLAIAGRVHRALGHVVHGGDVAMRPDGDGCTMLSSRAIDATLDPATRAVEPDSESCLELARRASRLFPALCDATIQRTRVGVRSVPADGLPAAGFAPTVENLYVLITHSGATLAPVLGRLVASELTGHAEDVLDPYRPARFA